MIILTAGHTGPNTGATGTIVEHHGRIDEGTETIRLRNRIAEILAEKWGIITNFPLLPGSETPHFIEFFST